MNDRERTAAERGSAPPPGGDSYRADAEPRQRGAGNEPRPGPPRGVEELRRRAMTLGFAAVALAAFSLLIAIYWQLATPILWAGTLAVLFYPLHRLVVRLVRGRETVGAVLSTGLVLAVFFIPAIIVVIHLVREVRNILPAVSDGLGPDTIHRIAQNLEASRFRAVAHLLVGGDAAGGADLLQLKFHEVVASAQEFLLQRLRLAGRSLPGAFIQVGITVVGFYFFLRNGPAWVRGLERALPLEREHAARLFAMAGQTINVVFRGVILTAGCQAVAAGLGYWVAGAPLPVLLTVFTFVAAVIPLVGAAAVWVLVALGLFLAGHTGAAIGLAIYGTLFVSLLDNVLRPLIIGRGMQLPLLWLFLAIVGGLKLFGFLGVVAGPMVLALAMAVYRIYQEGWRETSEAARASGPPRVDPTTRL